MEHRRFLGLVSVLVLGHLGCSSSSKPSGTPDAAKETTGDAAGLRDGAPPGDARLEDARMDTKRADTGRSDASPVDATPVIDAAACGGCPTGYTCGTANHLPVCRAPSGIPLFSHVYLIIEENTSLSTLEASINANAAPNFASLQKTYASGTAYHGVAHPSLPNYIALTSGGTQGITCDCAAGPGQGACSGSTCTLIDTYGCSCPQSVTNLADQLETASKTWMAYGESMGTPCNYSVDAGDNFAMRHVPFLYYDDIQTNAARCDAHVVDYSTFDPSSSPDFTYIAPNLIDDMHSPVPATQGNITNGDTWIGPVVTTITGSAAYTSGALFVIAWDEDDDSGIGDNDAGMFVSDTNAPIPIFVLSPYAKSAGYMSAATLDHYSLLATIEDGLDLPRMGSAATPRPNTADTLADFFPRE